jgi:uncharacterized membrane protein YadS
MFSGLRGDTTTSPGDEMLGKSGVVMPTTPNCSPSLLITALLAMLLGMVLASWPSGTTKSARSLSEKSRLLLRYGNVVPG